MTCYGWAPWNVEKVGYLLKVAISVDILCESLICLFYTWFCCTSNVCWNSYIGCLKTVFFTSVIMCKAARCRINGFPQWFQFRDRVWTHAGAIGWVSMGLDGCKVRPYEYVPSGHFFNHGQIHTFNGIEILQARSNHWRLWKKGCCTHWEISNVFFARLRPAISKNNSNKLIFMIFLYFLRCIFAIFCT